MKLSAMAYKKVITVRIKKTTKEMYIPEKKE